MNEHSLEDLIIGEPVSPNKKSKSFLAIVALVIIVLLVGILLARAILDTSGDGVALNEENQTLFVNKELIPMVSENNQRKEGDLLPIKKENLPKVIKKKETPKKVQAIQKANKAPQKRIEKKPATKPKKRTAPKKPSTLFSSNEKPLYYIQIGAFNRDPNPKFLHKIEQAGLQYKIQLNEKTRRVRVGPYGSYTEAKAALTDVNSSIGIMGFVVKQK